jgi:hypothetical protein
MHEDKALDLLSKTNWGTDWVHVRMIVSGNVVETYEYEKGLMVGGNRRKSQRSGKRVSRIRRAFSIRRARLRIRRVISANIGRFGSDPLFVTFTFRENIKDLVQANRAWGNFIRRWNREFGVRLLYLVVVEFQKRGAVHYHAVFFNVGFVEFEKISDLWGQGFVFLQKISHVESLGAYVSKYLQKGVVDSRLFNEKVYFTSRGLFKPFLSYSLPVDNFMDSDDDQSTMVLQAERRSYSQWLGLIKYKRYKIQ